MQVLVLPFHSLTLSYCLKCKKTTESLNPVVSKTSNGKTIILSQCDVCGGKNQDLLKYKNHVEY